VRVADLVAGDDPRTEHVAAVEVLALGRAEPSRPSISANWASRAEKSLKMVKPKICSSARSRTMSLAVRPITQASSSSKSISWEYLGHTTSASGPATLKRLHL
jgi:hypothetical protein